MVSAMRRVLVTGMSGLIGTAVRRRLEGRFTLRALNRRPVAGVECHQADIGDLAAIAPAFDGVDAVVHLAANVVANPPVDAIVRDNVVGTYNVFEAARRAGVRRVIYASSGATVSDWERDEPYAALVAQGIGVWLGVQVFINMGVNMGVLPTKGLTLPLMSFGGSGLLSNCVALAILLRIDWENRQIMRGVRA